jgi:hypothetical protein
MPWSFRRVAFQERRPVEAGYEESMSDYSGPIAVVLIVSLACAGCSEPVMPEPHMVMVPQGTPVTIDGILSPGEWDAAYVDTFGDGSELLLMRDAEYLYLAIRGNSEGMIAANVYTEENAEIIIRHASAALGTAVYRSRKNDWLKTQDFEWECRATDDGEVSQRERSDFLKEEGWLAANSRMGTPNELEYQLKVTGEKTTLAVAFMWSSAPEQRVFLPLDLADDTTRATPGGLPETRGFSPETWMVLDLPN